MTKARYLYFFIIASIFIGVPVLFWLAMQPLSFRFSDFFNSFRSIGQLCGLLGMSLFSLNFLLAARIKILEKFFGGLNQEYSDHHIIGAWAFVLLLMHPLMLAIRFLSVSVTASGFFLFSSVTEPIFLLGTLGLFIMMALLILTFYLRPEYQIWKFSHKFLALSFLLGFVHMLVVSSDVSSNIMLRVYMIILGILSFFAIGYRTVLPQKVVKKYAYRIHEIKNLTPDIFEVILAPIAKKITYQPGQFAYFRFRGKGIPQEEHPFSIASNPADPFMKIIVKKLGDFTSRFGVLKPGDSVFVEGPFGVFLESNAKNQIWIAGGIGVTPFLGKIFSIPSDSQVSMFYAVRNESEAIYLKELTSLAETNKNFHFFPWFSDIAGHLTAEKIKEIIGEIPENCEISICGPLSLMDAIQKQLLLLGIPADKIKSEGFSL